MQQQHPYPLFEIFTRGHLSKVTGYSKVYLCRVASGKVPLTRAFIDRCCLALKRPAEELFLADDIAAAYNSNPNKK